MQSVTSSDKAGYEALLKIYRETDVSQERTRVLSKSSFGSSTCQISALCIDTGRVHFPALNRFAISG